jgi:heat shock protein HspQ
MDSSSSSQARFSIGQIVHHKLFDYRGVVYDVDPCFMGSDEWYDQVARSRPPKDQPWYRVLVNGKGHETYVAERNLEEDVVGGEVRNPALWQVFEEFKDGVYVTKAKVV